MRALRLSLLLIVVMLSLLLSAAASGYGISDYWNGLMNRNMTVSTCCERSREWNRVYRPLYYEFCLQYNGTSFPSGMLCNGFSNPFVDGRDAFLAYAWCTNDDHYNDVYPVTCSTTFP